MQILEVKAESRLSKILIGEQILNLPQYIEGRNAVIITDTNLLKHYGNMFPEGIPVIEIGLGEKNKTFSTLELIFEEFLKYEVDRSTLVIAIGGGIVCDVAGFAASTFMRGMPVGFVSTSLLSQVDASVGGKNGVNFHGYKNMVGVFNQPEFVICDIEMLKTLERKEFVAGFSEIIKAGIIRDLEFFNYCSEHALKALNFDEAVLSKLVYDAVAVKAKVVEADEKEKGERRLLNLGHTFAHAIEKLTGILHGEAVSIGIVLAAMVSKNLGMLSVEETDRIKAVLKSYGLPIEPNIDVGELFSAMKQDKKREGEEIHLVLIESIGIAITKKIPYSQLENIVNDLRSDFR